MNDLLNRMVEECKPYCAMGDLPVYIPELSGYDKNTLGIYIQRCDGKEFFAGGYNAEFTMQSVSKTLILISALIDSNIEEIKQKISFEASHESFNSIVSLETHNSNKPLNPMINSGAILCLSFVSGKTYADKLNRIIALLQEITGMPTVTLNESVYLSEKATGSRNRALAYFMKSTGVLDADVEDVLDSYFRACAICVTTKELAQIAAALANKGFSVTTGKRVFSSEIARTLNAVMSMCGMYDESGSYSIDVGLPSKSGVSGGILAVAPGKMGIGVYGPSLNEKGSSLAGIELLKRLSGELNIGIF